ncbi:MAG: hypothetical protein HOP15_12315 [Planctomycetes bacterium]|nr:hypothetical protein [Planctomycetota bacterium]
MRILSLWVVCVLGLGLRAEAAPERETPSTARHGVQPAAKRAGEATPSKPALLPVAKPKAQKAAAAQKPAGDAAFGSAARRALLAQRASLKGKPAATKRPAALKPTKR